MLHSPHFVDTLCNMCNVPGVDFELQTSIFILYCQFKATHENFPVTCNVGSSVLLIIQDNYEIYVSVCRDYLTNC